MKSIDEILDQVQADLEKALEVQEYEIGDRRVRRPRLRELMDYEDRMLARKARKDNNYKSHVYVRFNWNK